MKLYHGRRSLKNEKKIELQQEQGLVKESEAQGLSSWDILKEWRIQNFQEDVEC